MTYEEMISSIRDAYGSRISETNAGLIVDMCLRLGMDPGFVADLMAHESGFNPQARNPNSSATGLIQFIEKTAEGLGTSTDELYEMSFSEQMKFVEAYFEDIISSKGPLVTEADTYMAVFYPSAIGKPDYKFNSSVTSVNKSTTVGDYVSNVRKTAKRLGGPVGALVFPAGVWELGSSSPKTWAKFAIAALSAFGFAVYKKSKKG